MNYTNSQVKRILILTADYPTSDNPSMMRYVHTRNLEYSKQGLEIENLSFGANQSYDYEGIRVITLEDFLQSDQEYSVALSHAANLRNHYALLSKHHTRFAHLIYFFHGHEVLNINRVYPKEFDFVGKRSFVKVLAQELYDRTKFFIWRRFFRKTQAKSHFVFVSDWMKNQFFKWIKLDPEQFKSQSYQIYNGIGQDFTEFRFDPDYKKDFDFLTIRSNIDGSKYAIDIVNRMAHQNPERSFLVVGKGQFFEHVLKADNLTHLDKTLNHHEILEHIRRSRCALIPTRLDAQGVMACELASCGMPLITSDIPVCREVFEGFENVGFISNDDSHVDLTKLLTDLRHSASYTPNTKFFPENTTDREIKLIKNLTGIKA